jgi:hypothetical protein
LTELFLTVPVFFEANRIDTTFFLSDFLTTFFIVHLSRSASVSLENSWSDTETDKNKICTDCFFFFDLILATTCAFVSTMQEFFIAAVILPFVRCDQQLLR